MTSRYHMFCANKVRSAIAKALLLENGGEGHKADERDASAFVTNVDSRRPFRKNIHPQHAAILMHSMRNHLDVVVDQAGAMERIKATRLPIVYVAHLRTVRIGLSQIPPLFAITRLTLFFYNHRRSPSRGPRVCSPRCAPLLFPTPSV
jgi:hypothetical protein